MHIISKRIIFFPRDKADRGKWKLTRIINKIGDRKISPFIWNKPIAYNKTILINILGKLSDLLPVRPK
jgi:hypothetical protein